MNCPDKRLQARRDLPASSERDYYTAMPAQSVSEAAFKRREHILQVAAEVFSGRGYRRASIADIVEKAGIARGTFYLYFESKREVFLELIERYFTDFAELLNENHSHLENTFRNGGNALKAWRDNVMRIMQYHCDNPHLTSIVYREALGKDEDFSERVNELSGLARDRLVAEFRMMEKHGMLRPCDLEIVATIVMGSTVNIIMEHLLKESGRNLESLADEIMSYHIRALMPAGLDADRVVKIALA